MTSSASTDKLYGSLYHTAHVVFTGIIYVTNTHYCV